VRVFVHEFITSGALSGETLPGSLLREGEAMRRAVVCDLLRLPGVDVVTTRDERVPRLALSGLTEVAVTESEAELRQFRSLCAAADRSLIIAPEIGGELGRRVDLAIEAAGRNRVLNAPELIGAASDKWETFLRLEQAQVPTIATCLGDSADRRAWEHAVAKPRDGAGSQGVTRLTTSDARAALSDRWIVQPFITGRWLSCTLLFHANGRVEPFPPAEQRLSDDGTFAYLGGAMPAACDVERVQALALEAVRAVAAEGARVVGPVGVDLVEECTTGTLLVCEVNPRFTTSFVAAREVAESNLLAGLFGGEAPFSQWRTGRIEFDAAGCTRLSDAGARQGRSILAAAATAKWGAFQ